jgi:hydroxymethylpyrimidine pyrophosphatase-like HAD family hydrolase
MPRDLDLPRETAERLRDFRRGSRFAEAGGVVTDLDGTAVHERDGRVYVAEPVAEGLKALADLGRPVVVNTLRFPLNVIRTFGREWGAITSQPVPLVSLNGAVMGLLTPVGDAETTFDELAAFPLSAAELEAAVAHLEGLLAEGLNHILLFVYPRDWGEGEIIWTPRLERVPDLKAKYLSASSVISGSMSELRDMLLSHGACMLSVLVDIPEDRRMAYQHANPSRFFTTAGVDKLSGAREAAARLGFDLDQSVGAGDTPMDSFLAGVGLAIVVGPLELAFQGRRDTLRLRDAMEFGAALFELARLDAEASR